jgi:uncharacterized protein (TIGR02145 family)
MKKFFFIISLLLMAFSLFAQQEPLMKIYFDGGSTKQFNLKDIDSLGIIDNKNFYDMKIHYQDSLIAYYPTEIIGSIKFENDTNNHQVMNVYLFGYPKTYVLSSIDSIIFYKDIYQPLTIGTQVWMLKNLNVDHFRNGDSIKEVRDSAEWSKLNTGAWCYYYNSDSLGKIYGKLYNWYAVNDPRGLAPEGWHIPTNIEWDTLSNFLGGFNIAGDKLKESGSSHWETQSTSVTNESGFSGLPGGERNSYGEYKYFRNSGCWWSASEDGIIGAWYYWLQHNEEIFGWEYHGINNGLSVRCIKDK